MNGKAEYRSAIRSRASIRKAYVELMREQNTAAISVKELVARADINRSTFYAHYQDIYAVLEEIEAEIAQKLVVFLGESDRDGLPHTPLAFLTRLGAELEQNREFYRLMLDTQGSVAFIHKLKEVILERMMAGRNELGPIRRQKEFLVSMRVITGGAVAIFSDWVAGKVDMPMSELVTIVNEVVTNAARQYD